MIRDRRSSIASHESVEPQRRSNSSRGSRNHNSLSRSEEHQHRWLVSYADLLTLLLALFVVLFASADEERARHVAASIAQQFGESEATTKASGDGVLPGSDSLIAEQQMIEEAFKSHEALRGRARVSTTERGLIVSLAEAGFFAPGEAIVRPDALAQLDALADALRNSRKLIRVEGHTDSTPIQTSRYPSNWELSAARASVVLARLVARGHDSSRLSVAGYAGERPIADNATAEGRALNRRVDLIILRAVE